MQRRPQRQTPSSPLDRFASAFERRDTELGSIDREDRTERRSAHLWNRKDDAADILSPSYQPPKEDNSFEDFRPADPVSRLDSSAQAARSASNPTSSVRGSSTHGSFPSVKSPEATATTPQEMMDPQGNIYPDIDRKQMVHGVDWATPPKSADGKQNRTGSQGTGSTVPVQQVNPDRRQSSFELKSQDSVESHRTTLKNLKTSSTNDYTSTMSSVARWLRGQRRRKSDLRLAGLAKNKIEEDSPEPESPAGLHQHISTFQPADQHITLNTRSRSQERESREDRTARRPSIAPGYSPRQSPWKEHKLFGSFGLGHKERTKEKDVPERRPSTIDSSRKREDPFGQLSPLTYEPTKASGRGRTGYFSRTSRLSEGDEAVPVKGPYVGFSRRTKAIESPPEGGGKLKIPEPSPPEQGGWLKPRRPRFMRYSSSPISPGDTFARAMDNPAAYDQWKAALDKRTPPLQLNDAHLHVPEPIQSAPVLPKHASTYLATEAQRVRTPPHSGKWQGNKKMGYFWDSWYPHGAEKEGSDKGINRSNQWHTPFPMPQDSSITTSFNDSETGGKDWYRIRMDRILGEEEPRDLDELRMFEWDLPEHLPESPLCPLSPKHPSKGKGVCVYHGRKRRGGTVKNTATGLTPADIGVDLWK